MKQIKKEKAFWNKYFNFPGGPADISPAIKHISFNCTEVDDEDLGYLVSRIKVIEMLDLELTQISNAGIKEIAKLKGLRELKLKDNYPISNDCIADLNKLTGLEMLHVRATSINIDGLLQLTALPNLKRLFFSEEDVDSISEKMLQLKYIMPNCEFIIDGKVYTPDVIAYFTYANKGTHCSYRMKIKNEPMVNSWSNWLTNPSCSYYETENQGPYSVDVIEWIEINPVESSKEGRLVAEKKIDHLAEIIKLLEDLLVPVMEVDGIIRVYVYKGL